MSTTIMAWAGPHIAGWAQAGRRAPSIQTRVRETEGCPSPLRRDDLAAIQSAVALHQQRRPARLAEQQAASAADRAYSDQRNRMAYEVYFSGRDLPPTPEWSGPVRPRSPEDARWQECLRRVTPEQVCLALAVQAIRDRAAARAQAVQQELRDAEAATAARRERAIAARERHILATIEGPLQVAYAVCGYRRSHSRWVGGEHSLILHVTDRAHQEPSAVGGSTEVWHKKHAWKGTSSTHTLRVRPTWCDDVLMHRLSVLDGLLTIDARPIEQADPSYRAWTARWVEQGRGVSITQVDGVIVRLASTGETVHGTTIAGALRTLHAREREARLTRLDAAVREQLQRGEIGDLAAIIVTVADSDGAGNCATGTRSWIERHMPGRDSATVAEILLVGDRSEAVLRAVLHAVRRARPQTGEVAHA